MSVPGSGTPREPPGDKPDTQPPAELGGQGGAAIPSDPPVVGGRRLQLLLPPGLGRQPQGPIRDCRAALMERVGPRGGGGGPLSLRSDTLLPDNWLPLSEC